MITQLWLQIRKIDATHKWGQAFILWFVERSLVFMARLLRLEFPGAVYRITARGDGHESIFGAVTCRDVPGTSRGQGTRRACPGA